MDIQTLKRDVITYSKKIGIDRIGFTTADPFITLKEKLIEQEKLKYASGFEKGTVAERTEPKRLMKEAKSIISVALSYPAKIKHPPKSSPGKRRGIFCRASWGEDYHHVVRSRLEQLAAYIEEKVDHFSYKIMVDTGELSDRAVAERAGVGFSGKNTLLITKEFGSFVYLGEMMTNIPFTPDNRVEETCGDCRKCLDACPTGALVQPGQLNAQRCLAYLTQTKDFVPDEFREKIGTRLYGCDTCQSVCPYNKGVDFHLHPEFEPEPEVAKPLLRPMLKMSNRQFREKFGHVSGFWRGKNPLQRNALLALAHYKDETAIDDLIELLEKDVRPVIRGTAAWALGKIGGKDVEEVLDRALVEETDERVREEIKKGLQLGKN